MRYQGQFLTTDLVLIEFANSLAMPQSRCFAVAIIEKMRVDHQVSIAGVSPALLTKAFELYKQRQDKAWGMVDCFSFVVMAEKACTAALTFDEHFRQAGFEIPLLAGD